MSDKTQSINETMQDSASETIVNNSQETEQKVQDKMSVEVTEKTTEKATGKVTDNMDNAVGTASQQTQVAVPKKTKKGLVIGLVIGAVLLVILGMAGYWYQQKAEFYKDHFFPGTVINGYACSDMEASAVAAYLNQQPLDYTLRIMGRDEAGNSVELGVLDASDINLRPENYEPAAAAILYSQDAWMWVAQVSEERKEHSIVQGLVYDEQLLQDVVSSWDSLSEKNMIRPADAYISAYNEEKNAYEIIPEIQGTYLDLEQVLVCVKEAVEAEAQTLDLTEAGCYAEPAVYASDATLNQAVQDANTWLKTDITYDWNTFDVKVDKSVIKDWVSIVNNKAVLDEEAIAAFVGDRATTYDTYGKNRRFMTTMGVELNLPSGAFGWQTDRKAETAELIALIRQGNVTEREPIYSWKAPWKGMNDIGNTYVEADLTHQHLYLYYQGNLVLETDFVSGDMNKSDCITPQGVFGLTYKTLNAVLRGADYVTPVTYWMPFHGNFGMHDATWRTEFGGDIYLYDGSHGCLNLPLEKAGEIYNYMYEGFPIICYYYPVTEQPVVEYEDDDDDD